MFSVFCTWRGSQKCHRALQSLQIQGPSCKMACKSNSKPCQETLSDSLRTFLLSPFEDWVEDLFWRSFHRLWHFPQWRRENHRAWARIFRRPFTHFDRISTRCRGWLHLLEIHHVSSRRRSSRTGANCFPIHRNFARHRRATSKVTVNTHSNAVETSVYAQEFLTLQYHIDEWIFNRWQKCVAKASSDYTGFGMAVGHKYVQENFDEAAKVRVSTFFWNLIVFAFYFSHLFTI